MTNVIRAVGDFDLTSASINTLSAEEQATGFI
jgi:hypothetical protein